MEVARTGGYDPVMFTERPDPRWICGICKNVIIEPSGLGCADVFCKSCLEVKLGEEMRCPVCEKVVPENVKIRPVEGLKEEIEARKVRCQESGGGETCTWEGDLPKLLIHHNDECLYHETACTQEGPTPLRGQVKKLGTKTDDMEQVSYRFKTKTTPNKELFDDGKSIRVKSHESERQRDDERWSESWSHHQADIDPQLVADTPLRITCTNNDTNPKSFVVHVYDGDNKIDPQEFEDMRVEGTITVLLRHDGKITIKRSSRPGQDYEAWTYSNAPRVKVWIYTNASGNWYEYKIV